MTAITQDLTTIVRNAQENGLSLQRNGYYHKHPGWFEGLGLSYTDPLDALVGEGYDAEVKKHPLKLSVEGMGDIPFNKYYGLVREPTVKDPHIRATGVVTNRFQPIQQRDVAEMLRPLAEQYPLEMITAYGQFEDHVVWGFRFGEFEIKPKKGRKSDPGMHWLYVDHVNDGSHGLRGLVMDIRIGCTNVLPHSFGKTKLSISLPHVGNVTRRLVDWIGFLNSAKKAAEEQEELYQHLAKVELPRPTIEQVFGSVYQVKRPDLLNNWGDDITENTPDDVADSVERYLLRVKRAKESQQAAIVALDTFNDRNPQFANTGWAALQGVTEVETWKTGRTRGHSLLFGDRAAVINKTVKGVLEAVGQN